MADVAFACDYRSLWLVPIHYLLYCSRSCGLVRKASCNLAFLTSRKLHCATHWVSWQIINLRTRPGACSPEMLTTQTDAQYLQCVLRSFSLNAIILRTESWLFWRAKLTAWGVEYGSFRLVGSFDLLIDWVVAYLKLPFQLSRLCGWNV